MSAALAKEVRKGLGFPRYPKNKIDFSALNGRHDKIENLNNSGPITFNAPPKKKKGSKFRMHPFKAGNMTVTLTNFAPKAGSSETSNGKKWYCSIFLGSGKDFIIVPVTKKMYTKVRSIDRSIARWQGFQKEYLLHFKGKVGSYKELQSIYEQNKALNGKLLVPLRLLKK